MSDKLRVITDTPAPKPAESENPISQTIPWAKSVTDFLKDDSPLMQVIGKIPFLAPLKDMIGGLKNFLEKIGIQLGDLKNEVEQTTGQVITTITSTPSSPTKTESNSDKLESEQISVQKPQESRNHTKSTGASYATNKPLGDNVKLLRDLTFEESQGFARKIFGNWPATDLLIKLDGGSGMMIKRMVALGEHEGGLKFGRQNPDPKSGFNIGTFQIGGAWTNKNDSMNKYKQCYEAGAKLAKQHGIETVPFHLAPNAQRDLLTHLGYIESQRGGSETFAKLRNPNLTDQQVVTLMHRKIQGGIAAIGHSVVRQIAGNKIDTSTLA